MITKHEDTRETASTGVTIKRLVMCCLHCKSPGRIIHDFSVVYDFPFKGDVWWKGNQYVRCTNQQCGAEGGKEFVTTNDLNGRPDMMNYDVLNAVDIAILRWNRKDT